MELVAFSLTIWAMFSLGIYRERLKNGFKDDATTWARWRARFVIAKIAIFFPYYLGKKTADPVKYYFK